MPIGKNSIARAGAAVSAASAPEKNAAPLSSVKAPILSLQTVATDRLRPLAVFSGEPSPELVRSLRKYGVLVPLLAAQVGDSYLVLLGEHRLAAARTLGIPALPVSVISAADEAEALRIMQEIRNTRSSGSDSLQNEKFYAAASLGEKDIPVFLL